MEIAQEELAKKAKTETIEVSGSVALLEALIAEKTEVNAHL